MNANYLDGMALMPSAVPSRELKSASPSFSGGKRKGIPLKSALGLAGYLLTMIAGGAAPSLEDLLVPAGTVVEGRTLPEWTARWWQWLLGLPTDVSPILDTNGVHAHEGQSGSVFFVGGGVTTGGDTFVLSRRVTITSDLYLFFPVINWTGENVGRAVPLSAQALRDEVVSFVSGATGVFANLDGEDVPPEKILRILAPVFHYDVPDEMNIFQFFGLDLPGGTITPVVSDGFWVMLKPLPVGEHVLQFRGFSADNEDSAHVVQYTLTVRDPTPAERVDVLQERIREEQLPDRLTRSLVRPLELALTQLDRGRLRSGMQRLTTFQRTVKRQLAPIDSELAATLTQRAQAILDLAETGGRP